MARAFVDQLERSKGLAAARITAVRTALAGAEKATRRRAPHGADHARDVAQGRRVELERCGEGADAHRRGDGPGEVERLGPKAKGPSKARHRHEHGGAGGRSPALRICGATHMLNAVDTTTSRARNAPPSSSRWAAGSARSANACSAGDTCLDSARDGDCSSGSRRLRECRGRRPGQTDFGAFTRTRAFTRLPCLRSGLKRSLSSLPPEHEHERDAWHD